MLARTYKKVSKSFVAATLGLSDPTAFLEEKGQKVSGDDVLISTSEQSEPQTVARENIPFSRILPIISLTRFFCGSLT